VRGERAVGDAVDAEPVGPAGEELAVHAHVGGGRGRQVAGGVRGRPPRPAGGRENEAGGSSVRCHGGQPEGGRAALHRSSGFTTSPSLAFPIRANTAWATVNFTDRTDPSANTALIPFGWLDPNRRSVSY